MNAKYTEEIYKPVALLLLQQCFCNQQNNYTVNVFYTFPGRKFYNIL